MICCTIFLFILSLVHGFDLTCRVTNGNAWKVSLVNHCTITNLNITSPNRKITSVNGKTATNQHEGFYVQSQNVHYLPTEISSFFLNVKSFRVSFSKLKEISKNDLKAFTNLMELSLSGNDLEKLDGDLFEHNRKLEYLNLDYNKLKHVGEELLRNINLNQAHFSYCGCINAFSNSSITTSTIIQKLISQCPSTKEMKTLMRFKEDIKEFKTKLESCVSEEKFEDKIASIETKLESCDGNLNTATKHFYEMTRQSERQMQRGNFSDISIHLKVLTVVVQVDGSKFTAVGWKIDASSIHIDSVKDTKENFISLPATAAKELIIEDQQTFFLPSNLGKQFPMLEVLAVTSSGLYEIYAGILNKMTILKTLNLAHNKIHEIPIGSFSENKNLENLDLSFNLLEYLDPDTLVVQLKLQNLNLRGNRLKYLSPSLLKSFEKLEIADLSDNECINMKYPESTLKEIEDNITDNCVAPIEIECYDDDDQPFTNETQRNREHTCMAQNVVVKYPKTKISPLKNDAGASTSILYVQNQQMLFLPFEMHKIFIKLNVIIVENSLLTTLSKHDLEGLKDLKNISITGNNISMIGEGAFDDVPQLEVLILSSNNIQSLPSKLFGKLKNLQVLKLSDNKLKRFAAEVLPPKSVIKEFNIENNELEIIGQRILRYLRVATVIDFSGNDCIDFKYEKENPTTTVAELFLQIDMNCSED